jgi:nickel-dependent lactate racemase
MEIPFGRGKVALPFPSGWAADLLRPNAVPPAPDPAREVSRSLESLLGADALAGCRSAQSVAVAVSDETRPVPHSLILPILLKKLEACGVSKSSIRILIASGLHPPLPPSRFPNILPAEVLRNYPVEAHDAKAPDLLFLGKTSRETPVYVNPRFRKADLRIAVGLIDPHQFVGYTGGVKCAAVGLAGAQTIERNHSLLFHPQAVVGEIQDNPVRRDLEEVGKLMGVDFAFNVVLGEANRIVKAFAGEPREVEKVGSEFCRTVYEIPVSREYDVVIASPGGYPKDLNLYQAQKGLAHATPIVRRGGDLVLLAECPDGHGEEEFYRTMKRFATPAEIVEKFPKEPFRMGAHKAFLWARSLAKAEVHMCSAMGEEMSRLFMASPARSPEEIFAKLQKKYPVPPAIAVMTKANSTYARIQAPR